MKTIADIADRLDNIVHGDSGPLETEAKVGKLFLNHANAIIAALRERDETRRVLFDAMKWYKATLVAGGMPPWVHDAISIAESGTGKT